MPAKIKLFNVLLNDLYVRNKDEVTKEKLAVARLLILTAPKEKFKNSEDLHF